MHRKATGSLLIPAHPPLCHNHSQFEVVELCKRKGARMPSTLVLVVGRLAANCQLSNVKCVSFADSRFFIHIAPAEGDNTVRELKNQWAMLYNCRLAQINKFRMTAMFHLRKSHTHDQIGPPINCSVRTLYMTLGASLLT